MIPLTQRIYFHLRAGQDGEGRARQRYQITIYFPHSKQRNESFDYQASR